MVRVTRPAWAKNLDRVMVKKPVWVRAKVKA
jgi:hypothetical protein